MPRKEGLGEGGDAVPAPENSPQRLHPPAGPRTDAEDLRERRCIDTGRERPSLPFRRPAGRCGGHRWAAPSAGVGLVSRFVSPARRLVPQGLSQGPDGSTNTLGEAPPGGIPRVPSPSFPRIRRNVLHPCTLVPEDSPEDPESTHQAAPKCLSYREKVSAKVIKGFEGIRAIQRQGALLEQASQQYGERQPGFCSKEGVLNGSTRP